MEKKTQKTPKGKEIPIPKRSDVFKVFKQATKPEKESATRINLFSQGIIATLVCAGRAKRKL